MQKSIITIAGRAGSGKSSTAKEIASQFNWNHFSSGDFLRAIAKERGITITELMKLAETEKEIDYEIDAKLRDLKTRENLIIDSRLAFHWIPESFKVFLELDPEIASKRMFADLKSNKNRQATENYRSEEEMSDKLKERSKNDIARYKNLYNIDYTDHANFDLVIDTSKSENNLESVVSQIIQKYKIWKGEE